MTDISQSVQEAMRLADVYAVELSKLGTGARKINLGPPRDALESHLTAAFTDVRARAIDTQGPANMNVDQWVRVSDRFPVAVGWYLVAQGQWVGALHYNDWNENKWYWETDEGHRIEGITHWMPLPDPPPSIHRDQQKAGGT